MRIDNSDGDKFQLMDVTDSRIVLTADSSGNVGIGTSSPVANLEITQSGNNVGLLVAGGGYNYTAKFESSDAEANIIIEDSNSTNDGNRIGVATNDMYFITDNSERMRIDSSGRVGIGTSSPAAKAHVAASSYTAPTGGIDTNINLLINNTQYSGIQILGRNDGSSFIHFGDQNDANVGIITYEHASDYMAFWTNASERMRIDSSGNLLVGKTSSGGATVGAELRPNGDNFFTRASGASIQARRNGSDGDIAIFYKDSTTVGSIGAVGNNLTLNSEGAGGYGRLQTQGVDRFIWYQGGFYPAIDNIYDLGVASSGRWNDAYITNGVTTGSDGNDKQDIRDLTEAEQRVAVACKGLLKAWRWKSAVEEKGDNARIHCGIIAQDLQAAFAAEGLDAGRYAMFMLNTWWEHDVEVPAVEAVAEVLDEEGNVVTEAVEAKDAYTRTDTYETQKEAPEGATERTRLGVRYSELLAFIIGAL
jgi:hypothetical protein